MMNLRSLARALGGEAVGRNSIVCPGPSHSPKDRSLSVTLDPYAPGGFIVNSFARDDWRNCRDYVRERLGLERQIASRRRAEAQRRASPPRREHDHRKREIARALSLWREGVDPRGTLAEVYLRTRSLDLGDDLVGRVLRWHAGRGALLALFRNIRNDEPQAISRTFLDRDGRKIERKFLGPVGGAAIKLDADENVLRGLHVGEGIETCLAARQLGLRPAWALGSKGAIGGFPVLGGIEAMTILSEPDAVREVESCAASWHAAGRKVFITRAIGGKDLNDALRTGL